MVTPISAGSDDNSGIQLREIQELAIAISAQKLNPTMLSEDFLKASGIIPNEWQLNNQPVLNQNYAQVTFQNGISIVTQPRTVTFLQMLNNPQGSNPEFPGIVHNYIDRLPHAEYQSLSISPKSIIPLSGGSDAARKYITTTLLAPGHWQDFGKAPVQAGLNLLYQLEQCQFTLNINEAVLQLPDKRSIPALLFAGSFNYNLVGDNEQERLKNLHQGINQWSADLEAFREIVNQRFLEQQNSIFPKMVIPSLPLN